MGLLQQIQKTLIDILERLFYYLLTPKSKEDKSLEKKGNEIKLTEAELRILSALRDPIKGPLLYEVMRTK